MMVRKIGIATAKRDKARTLAIAGGERASSGGWEALRLGMDQRGDCPQGRRCALSMAVQPRNHAVGEPGERARGRVSARSTGFGCKALERRWRAGRLQRDGLARDAGAVHGHGKFVDMHDEVWRQGWRIAGPDGFGHQGGPQAFVLRAELVLHLAAEPRLNATGRRRGVQLGRAADQRDAPPADTEEPAEQSVLADRARLPGIEGKLSERFEPYRVLEMPVGVGPQFPAIADDANPLIIGRSDRDRQPCRNTTFEVEASHAKIRSVCGRQCDIAGLVGRRDLREGRDAGHGFEHRAISHVR